MTVSLSFSVAEQEDDTVRNSREALLFHFSDREQHHARKVREIANDPLVHNRARIPLLC